MQGLLSCVARRKEMVRKKMKRKMNPLSRKMEDGVVVRFTHEIFLVVEMGEKGKLYS